MVTEIVEQEDCTAVDIAAAIAYLSQKDKDSATADYAEVQFEKAGGRRGGGERSRRSGRGRGRDERRGPRKPGGAKRHKASGDKPQRAAKSLP